MIISEKVLFERIKAAIEGLEKEFTVDVDTNKMDAEKVYYSFYEKTGSSYPNLTKMSCNKKWMPGSKIVTYTFYFEYRVGKVKMAMMDIDVTNKIEELSKQMFLDGMPPEAKIYLAHNYLCKTVKYNKNWENNLRTSYSQSAYGALIKRECTCSGFTEAFQKLMDVGGVKCYSVAGDVIGEGAHAWNIIGLGKKDSFHHIDVTWDAGYDISKYTHFCKPDSFYEKERKWNRNVYPKCSGKYAVRSVAVKYLRQHREELLRNGVDSEILDF